MKDKNIWIMVILILLILVGIFIYAPITKTENKTVSRPAISVSPITEEWVEREEERALRVTFGDSILEVPEKYNPSGLDKKLPALSMPLVWPSNSPTRLTEEDKYIYWVLIKPNTTVSNYDQQENIDWLLNNDYQLRQSVEYPSLMEYWSDEKNKSYYFVASYKPKILNKVFNCLPGFRENLIEISSSNIQVGDVSCRMYGVISDSVAVQVRFDARLLDRGKDFHQAIDELISSFIIKNGKITRSK